MAFSCAILKRVVTAMKFRSFSYFLKEAVSSLIKNRLMTLASIMTVASCIFIVSFSFCLAVNIDGFLAQMEGQLNLSVFLDDDLPPQDVPALREDILALPNVKDVNFISSEEAHRHFVESFGQDEESLLVAGLPDTHFLPRSFVITLVDMDNRDALLSVLEGLKPRGITEIRYDQDIINVVTALNTGIRIVSLIVILCLIIISIIIIINTIKITVNNRRTEVFIMKYIGATDWFIRWPFIIEGVLIGLFGALTAVSICWIGYGSVTSPDSEHLRFLAGLVDFKPAASVFAILLPLAIVLGIGIGAGGSVTSLRKYLQA